MKIKETLYIPIENTEFFISFTENINSFGGFTITVFFSFFLLNFLKLIQSDLWSRSNHGKAEERSFVTTISRVMSGHCSNPICV
jgi:hypothetical protein